MPPKLPPVPSSFETSTGKTFDEKKNFWRRTLRTDPARVVSVITLSPESPTTEHGDTLVEVFPALHIVMETARGNERLGSRLSSAWDRLIEAGVAEALCKLVIHMKLHPDSPKEASPMANKSSFHWAFEALSNACAHIQRPPTAVDKKLVEALKENWTEMMERLWNDPEDSLSSSEGHDVERIVPAQTAMMAFTIHPPFLSKIYDPEDMTIPTVVRHWKYSTGVNDYRLPAQLLWWLLSPQDPMHAMYMRQFPPPPPSVFIPRYLLGAGPFPTSTAEEQASGLVAAFADHISRLPNQVIFFDAQLLLVLTEAAQLENAAPELTRAVRTSAPLWKSIIGVLKQPEAAQQSSGGLSAPSESFMGLMANVWHTTQELAPDELEPLLQIWMDEGFFDGLDVAVGSLARTKGMPMQLSRLFMYISQLLEVASPAFKTAISAQFPRWATLGTLIRHDMTLQTRGGMDPRTMMPALGEFPPPESYFWDHSCWQTFGALQNAVLGEEGRTRCARRGCENKGKARCAACKSVSYCGAECQKKNWKEHKICCGHMQLVNDNPANRSLPVPQDSTSDAATLPSNEPSSSKATLDSVADLD